MNECEVCGSIHTEVHHIIFRSQMKGLEADWNKKRLCPDHHRGNQSPHRNKAVDLEYKRGVQKYLSDTLHKQYYSINQLIDTLGLSYDTVRRIVKPLQVHKEGFDREEIITRILGGRRYDISD